MSRTRNRWLPVAGVVAVLLALVGAGWLARDRILPVGVGSDAPDFAATDLRGRPMSVDSLRGEVVLLNIWATWCGPCREEMPSMQRLYQELGDEGLRIVAVSIDAASGGVDADGRPGGDIAAFGREYGLTFDLWHDPSGRVARTYSTTGVPESFVIGRDGRIVRKVIGATEWDAPANVELLRRLLRDG